MCIHLPQIKRHLLLTSLLFIALTVGYVLIPPKVHAADATFQDQLNQQTSDLSNNAADQGWFQWAADGVRDPIGSVKVRANKVKDAVSNLSPSNIFFSVINWILGLISGALRYLIKLFLSFIGPILTQGQFINHPYVQWGWPFVQGIANLGFIMVLLWIALATTLHIGNGNYYRLLPRLLLAALLINFSLVITGIIIDASRLVMAIMVQLLAGGNVDFIQSKVAQATQMANGSAVTATTLSRSLSGNSKGLVSTLGNLIQVLQLLAFAVALVFLAIGMITRYIALLLLLIVSPLAFLGFVLPQTQKMALSWWSKFLKYVIYGPVVLFLLVLINIPPQFNVPQASNITGWEVVVNSMLSLCITVGLLFAAAHMGKYAGTVGAAASLAFLDKQKSRIRSGAVSLAKGTAKLPFKVADKATGSVVSSSIGGFQDMRAASQARRDQAKRTARKNSIGGKIGNQLYGDPKQKAAFAAAIAASKKGIDPKLEADPIKGKLSPIALQKMAANLPEEHVSNIIENGNEKQLEALAHSVEAVAKMTDAQKGSIMQRATKDNKVDSALYATMRKVQDNQNKKV